jgi:hypothetical protein
VDEEPDDPDNDCDVSTEDSESASDSHAMPELVSSISDDDDSESYSEDGDDSESYGDDDDNEVPQGDLSTEIRRPKRKRRQPERYTAGASIALKATSQSSDMPSATEALKSEDADKWMEAIHSELASLREMKTWKLVDKEVPADARILPCTLVLKIKRHKDGTVER